MKALSNVFYGLSAREKSRLRGVSNVAGAILRSLSRAACGATTGGIPRAPAGPVCLESHALECRSSWRGDETNFPSLHCRNQGNDCSACSIGRTCLLPLGECQIIPGAGRTVTLTADDAGYACALTLTSGRTRPDGEARPGGTRGADQEPSLEAIGSADARQTKGQGGPGLVARRWWSQSVPCFSALWPALRASAARRGSPYPQSDLRCTSQAPANRARLGQTCDAAPPRTVNHVPSSSMTSSTASGLVSVVPMGHAITQGGSS